LRRRRGEGLISKSKQPAKQKGTTMLTLLKLFVLIIVGLAIALLVAGQMGLLRGTAPADLGLKNGQLKAPNNNPNSVSSQASLHPSNPFRTYADIAPLAYTGDGAAAFARAVAIIKAMPGTTLIEEKPGYLYAQCQTRLLKFTDDLELALDESARVIHVRSASRLGKSDMGVNRKRVEAIRAAMAGQ
jgi:uncharacterized protein (DUF1499 family)